MFGCETRAPLDIVVGTPPGEQHSYENVDQFVADRQHIMRDVYSAVREHLQRAAERRKKNYDVRVKQTQFKEGDWVLLLLLLLKDLYSALGRIKHESERFDCAEPS